MADVQLNGQSITTTSATTSPLSGSTETWTISPLSSGIPALTSGQTYALIDATGGATVSQQAEIIRVTSCTGPGATSITVIRGADSTTPVAHSATSVFNIVIVASAMQDLISQQNQIMSTAATIDELSLGFPISGVWNGSSVFTNQYNGAATINQTVWVAPYAAQIISAATMREFTNTAQDPNNYLQIQLIKMNADGSVPAGTVIVTKTTNDEAMNAHQEWSFDGSTWDTTAATFAKGDGLRIAFTTVGTTVAWFPMTITVRAQPL